MRRFLLMFGLGFMVALLAGWVAFPRVLYVQKPQPLEFRHKTHAEKSGIAECSECHALRDDGAPKTIVSTSCLFCVRKFR